MANIGGPENMAFMGTTRPPGYNINKQTWKENMQSTFKNIYSTETLHFGDDSAQSFKMNETVY